jgi:hypothetical protein
MSAIHWSFWNASLPAAFNFGPDGGRLLAKPLKLASRVATHAAVKIYDARQRPAS